MSNTKNLTNSSIPQSPVYTWLRGFRNADYGTEPSPDAWVTTADAVDRALAIYRRNITGCDFMAALLSGHGQTLREVLLSLGLSVDEGGVNFSFYSMIDSGYAEPMSEFGVSEYMGASSYEIRAGYIMDDEGYWNEISFVVGLDIPMEFPQDAPEYLQAIANIDHLRMLNRAWVEGLEATSNPGSSLTDTLSSAVATCAEVFPDVGEVVDMFRTAYTSYDPRGYIMGILTNLGDDFAKGFSVSEDEDGNYFPEWTTEYAVTKTITGGMCWGKLAATAVDVVSSVLTASGNVVASLIGGLMKVGSNIFQGVKEAIDSSAGAKYVVTDAMNPLIPCPTWRFNPDATISNMPAPRGTVIKTVGAGFAYDAWLKDDGWYGQFHLYPNLALRCEQLSENDQGQKGLRLYVVESNGWRHDLYDIRYGEGYLRREVTTITRLDSGRIIEYDCLVQPNADMANDEDWLRTCLTASLVVSAYMYCRPYYRFAWTDVNGVVHPSPKDRSAVVYDADYPIEDSCVTSWGDLSRYIKNGYFCLPWDKITQSCLKLAQSPICDGSMRDARMISVDPADKVQGAYPRLAMLVPFTLGNTSVSIRNATQVDKLYTSIINGGALCDVANSYVISWPSIGHRQSFGIQPPAYDLSGLYSFLNQAAVITAAAVAVFAVAKKVSSNMISKGTLYQAADVRRLQNAYESDPSPENWKAFRSAEKKLNIRNTLLGAGSYNRYGPAITTGGLVSYPSARPMSGDSGIKDAMSTLSGLITG